MRRIGLIGVAVLAMALFMAGVSWAGPDIKYGLWEITTKIEMEGMPFPMPPMKIRNCVEKGKEVPQQEEKNKDCKMLESKVSGNSVTWKMECRDKRSVTTSTGKVTYSGDSFKGNTTIVVKEGSDTNTMTQSMEGRRIGDCKK